MPKLEVNVTLTIKWAEFKEKALEEGIEYTKQCQAEWHLGEYDNWNFDQSVGDLIFSSSNGSKAVAKAQILGSYSKVKTTWLWSWVNETIDERLTAGAKYAYEYGMAHKEDFEILTISEFPGSDYMAWEMAYTAAKLNSIKDKKQYGVYCGPNGPHGLCFFMFEPPHQIIWMGNDNMAT